MKRRPSSSANRSQRVAGQLHHEIAELIRTDVKDPRLGLVTVTGVDLTPDYAYLTVHVSVLPDDEASVKASMSALRSAAGFLRGRLGRRVRIHTTPEIRFQHDRTTEQAMAMSSLIDQALSRTADDEPVRQAGLPDGGESSNDADTPGPRSARAAD